MKVKLWVRSAIGNFSTNLVKAYNASHKNQVELTVIPNDVYVQRVGAAAGSNTLPDMLASDVVFFPNFATKHVFTDITSRVNALPFKDALAQAHIKAASLDDKIYGVPSSVDGSALFWNKDLFRRAGLDPDKPPATYQEVIDDAKKITKLGKGVYGYHFGGNCGGCSVYTMFPRVWASGGAPKSDDGRTAELPSQQWRDVLGMYHQIWADGSAAPQSKDENGNTWAATFGSGKIGISPLGSGLINVVKSTNPKLTSASPRCRAPTAASTPPSSAATSSASPPPRSRPTPPGTTSSGPSRMRSSGPWWSRMATWRCASTCPPASTPTRARRSSPFCSRRGARPSRCRSTRSTTTPAAPGC